MQLQQLPLTYPEFKQKLADNIPVPNYYHYLIKHTDAILLDIAKTNQEKVAKSLSITPMKLSNIKHMLLALSEQA